MPARVPRSGGCRIAGGEVSGERLRAAATLLRERAEGAGEYPCADWTQQAVRHIARNCEIECNHNVWDDEKSEWIERSCPSLNGFWDRYQTGPFISMMSPPVALALAEWLDATTTYLQPGLSIEDDLCLKHALALADAILGANA